MSWQRISIEQALELDYHGVRGWLKIFYILAALSFFGSIYSLIDPDPSQLAAVSNNLGLLIAINLFFIAMQLPFLVLTPIWHPLMPRLTIACAWISSFAFVMLGVIIDDGMSVLFGSYVSSEAAATAVVLGVITTAFWTWYLLVSKRVNATYHCRVRHDDPILLSRRDGAPTPLS